MKKTENSRPGDYEKGKEALKKIGILLLNFILIFALFRLIISLSGKTEMIWIYYVGMAIYSIAAIVLFVSFFVLNGFTVKRESRSRDELPESWDDDKKDSFMNNQEENKKKARKLLYIILPLVFTLFISYIELNFIG